MNMASKSMQHVLRPAIIAALLFLSLSTIENVFAVDNDRSGSSPLQHRIPYRSKRSPGNSAIVTVAAPAVNQHVGTSFLVPVAVTDTTGEGIISWQFDLLFNPAIITPQAVPVSTLGTLGSGLVVTYNSPSPGLLKVVLFGTIPISGSGTLFNFQFTAVGAAGETSPLTWQNFMFNEGSPGSVATDGSVTLVSPTAAGVSVEGRITDPSGRPVRNAVVVLSGDSEFQITALTNAFGYFNFFDVPTGATYLISAETKNLQVRPFVLSVNDSVTGIELVAEPTTF